MTDNGNNLRDESGSLIGGLVVFEYLAGIEDFEASKPPPDITSPSYDLGRQRAAEKSGQLSEVAAWLRQEELRIDRTMEACLSPEQYTEYRRTMMSLRRVRDA